MKKLILAAVLAAVMLTGCDGGQSGTIIRGSVYPKITQYGADMEINTYYYAVDERTGVVYLLFNAYHCTGMTVALNADGSPVTKEQLKAWRSDNEHIS